MPRPIVAKIMAHLSETSTRISDIMPYCQPHAKPNMKEDDFRPMVKKENLTYFENFYLQFSRSTLNTATFQENKTITF